MLLLSVKNYCLLFLCISTTENKKNEKRETQNLVIFYIYFLGIPQGSSLGAISFIIFIADLFFINNYIDFASNADDTTTNVC